MVNKKILGIIGIGPRGSYALENLISNLNNNGAIKQIHLILFEETGNFGSGQVYDINQVKTNWINISERILYLNSRPTIHLGETQIPSFPSYHQWSKKDYLTLPENKTDTYPPRAKIGEYLQQRFETFIKPLLQAKIASLHKERVEDVTFLDNAKFRIRTNLNAYEHIDEVLLTIGHQPTEASKQILKWEKYFSDNENAILFKEPYPIKDF